MLNILIANSTVSLNQRLKISLRGIFKGPKLFRVKFLKPDKNPQNP